MTTRRRRMKSSWMGIGFSHHSVPSLSNTATRSSGGTVSIPPSVVTRWTKSKMACLLAPSRQLPSGSPVGPAWEGATSRAPAWLVAAMARLLPYCYVLECRPAGAAAPAHSAAREPAFHEHPGSRTGQRHHPIGVITVRDQAGATVPDLPQRE